MSAYMPISPMARRGYTQPPADAMREVELRVRAEREAVHLLDNFLRDRAEKKKGQHND